MRLFNNVRSVPRDLLSTPEVAKALGVSRTTVYRWWRQGSIEPEWITPGGQPRWDLQKVNEQLRREPRD